MDSSRPWLLIPIEVKVREFHGKMLLAAVAAEAGYNVIIGEQIELRSKLRFLPRGIVLEKGATNHQLVEILQSRNAGNRAVAWCEEGLVYRNRDAYLRDRVNLEAMDLIDRFFAWGSVQAADVLSKATSAAEKLVPTGNPRFDLLRPELRGLFQKQANRLRDEYGSYILVATNFSRVNHFRGPQYVSTLLQARGAQASPEISDFTRGWTEFLDSVYRAFLRMVPQLARAFPDLTIILRPHPSENPDSWKQALAGFPNVRVINQGTIIAWSLAASVVVHNSCTTGVESYLLDVPVIAYRPVTSETYDSKLPNALSHPASTTEELVAAITAIRNGGVVPGFTREEGQRRRATARQYITGVDGPWASDRIVKALDGVSVSPSKGRISAAKRISMEVTDVILALRTAVARMRGRLVVGTAYRRHKFPGLELSEVQRALDDFHEVSERFQGIRAERIPGLKNGIYLYLKRS